MRLVTSVVVCLLLFALPAFPQGAQSGGISGVVRDSSGAVIPGATIEVFNETTGVSERRLNAGDEGGFSATLLPSGTYRVEVTAPGFKQYRATVQVRINETTRHDALLEVGTVTEAVTEIGRAHV